MALWICELNENEFKMPSIELEYTYGTLTILFFQSCCISFALWNRYTKPQLAQTSFTDKQS